MSSEPAPAGKSTVRFEFAYEGDGAGITFAVDERVKRLTRKPWSSPAQAIGIFEGSF